MALRKGRVAIPLSKGINQKIDPKQEPPGSLKELENIQVDKFGEFEKRDGYDKVQEKYGYLSTSTTYPISNIQAVAALKDDLYILTDNKALSNSGLGKAIFEGNYSPATVKTKFVIQQQAYDAVHHDNVIKGDYAYSVYSLLFSGTTSTIYISSTNILDDTPFVTTKSISTTAYTRPKITSLGDKIVKFAVEKDSTDYYIVYNMASPLSYDEITSTSWTRITQTHSDQMYDIVSNEGDTTICLIHKEHSASKLQIISLFLDSDPAVGDVLGIEAGFQSTDTAITALGVTAITSTPRRQGVPTSTVDEGGFCVTYANATNIRLVTLDSFGVNTHVLRTFTHSGGTAWDLALGPIAITGIARDNNWSAGGTGGLTYDVYAQFQITATGTGTSNNVIPFIDNSTGAYSEDSLISTDFGSTGYINRDLEGSLNPVALSTWSYQTMRIGLWRNWSNLDATDVGNLTDQFACITGTLAAKPYLVDGDAIVPVGRNVTNRDSYYLYRFQDYDSTTNSPMGVMSFGTSDSFNLYDSTLEGYASVPNTSVDSNNNIYIPTKKKGRIESNNNNFYTLAVPSRTKISYNLSVANQNEEMKDNLIVCGSQLFSSDQMRFQEHNFVQAPDRLYVNTQNMVTTGTNHPFVANKTYNWIACYRYEDNSGNVHRSALSDQFTFALSSTQNYQNVDVLVPMVNFTAKYEFATYIELYRTEGDGTLFYRVSDLNVSKTVRASRNSKDFNFILIKDNTNDASLVSGELLYTTGGVLENTITPASSIMASYKNRLFLAGVESSEHLIYFSKQIQPGIYDTTPVEFSDGLTLEVPTDGGAIVALKKMDDKLIIFKERAIYMLTGEGPNNLGEQNDFIEPQLVSSDLGCKFANSVAFMPKGLMFMSQKGIFLLNRSLGLEYIGAPAEDYKDLTITKTTVVPKKSEIRFLASDGPTAIYNYFLNMWYTYSNHRGNSSCLVGNDYFLATYKDKVYKQVNTTASFGGAIVPIKLETGWLSFAGIQGYQRVYRMLLLGEYKSPHKLLIKIAYNYDDVWQQEKLIDVTSYTESYTYGSPTTGTQNTYGDPSGTSAIAYGGKDNTQYQIRLNFAKQKCESVKISIEEVEGSNPSGDAESAGPGFTLSNLSFIVGTKEGDFKIKQSRVFGSTSIT